jgi:hypothetical protein
VHGGGIRPQAVSCVIWSGPADLAEENGVDAAPQGNSYVILTGRAGPDGKRSEKELEKVGSRNRTELFCPMKVLIVPDPGPVTAGR